MPKTSSSGASRIQTPGAPSSALLKIGPTDEQSHGQKWDQKGRNAVVQIFISYDTVGITGYTKICSIKFQYSGNQYSEVFGIPEFCSRKFATVKLNYPSEYIVGISGYRCNDLKELTIHPNVMSYGPFGKAPSSPGSVDMKFDFQIGPGNQFAGFYGTHDSDSIKSIGLYLKPKPTGSSLQTC